MTLDYTIQNAVNMHGQTYYMCELYNINGQFIGDLSLYDRGIYSCHDVRLSPKTKETQYDIMKMVHGIRRDLLDGDDVPPSNFGFFSDIIGK